MQAPPGAPVLRIGIANLMVDATQIMSEITRRPYLKVTGAMDRRQVARDQFEHEFGARAYDSVEALCQDPDVDAVYLCTPNDVRAEHAILAAKHGKQVLVEKPMALTLEDCDRVIAAAEDNGVRLLAGHSESLTAPIERMGEIVRSGELGRLLMLNTLHFGEWMYRPRAAEELDPARGGGVMFRQAPHQVDILRLIGGGLVRSVRATTTSIDRERPVEGSYLAQLEFADGTPAGMVFNGYAHFDIAELTFGVDSNGRPRKLDAHLQSRRLLKNFARPEDERRYKESAYYGEAAGGSWADTYRGERSHPFFGLTIVSCEHGDVRQTRDGLMIYGDDEWHEEVLPKETTARGAELELMYDAWAHDRPVAFHDGRWAKATLEVCLGMIESARSGRTVQLQHQVPHPALG